MVWVLWLTRNKSRIQKIFPKKLVEIMFKIVVLLQSWKVLLRRPDQEKVEDLRKEMSEWLKSFEASTDQSEEDIWVSTQ